LPLKWVFKVFTKETKVGLKGRSVIMPGGLSGTRIFAVQMAKNIFGAKKIITMLSTGKIEKAKELLGGGPSDQIVDYTKEDVVKAIGDDSVDFMFRSVGATIGSLRMIKNCDWTISISTVPSGKGFNEGHLDIALPLKVFLDVANWIYETWTW
jgi:NADPH:quinone reductase-like Zn-dependent oxidoreductase